VENYINREEAD